MRHALSIDVEDWNESFGRAGVPPSLRDLESRVERPVHLLLELLARRASRATFFCLGTVAERHPTLIREIAAAGHRVACHGWEHRTLDLTDACEFRRHLDRSRKLLQDLSGQSVAGYRAPWFSLSGRTAWAVDVLLQAGFQYDSSSFPCWNPVYGDNHARLDVHRGPEGLFEVPLAVASLGPIRVPVAGGFYWRVLPWSVLRWGVERIEATGRPAVLYLHPWELDPEQPLVRQGLLASCIHYVGLSRTGVVLERVLERWGCSSIEEAFPQLCVS